MTQSDLINAILAALTFLGIAVALGLGVWSVNETKKLQKQQRAERLIQRIFQWLFKTRSTGVDRNLKSADQVEMAYKNATNAKSTFFLAAGDMFNELLTLSDEGKVLAIESDSMSKELSHSIARLCHKLADCADHHDKYQRKFLKGPEDMLKVAALAREWSDNDPAAKDEVAEMRKEVERQTLLLAADVLD